jgi:hypothetical protein
MTYFRHAAIAAATFAAVAAANAQTAVIVTEPAQTVVTTRGPLVLTPDQRQTVYRTIVREPVAVAPPAVEYRVGTRVPSSAPLYVVPESVAIAVPEIRAFKYMTVNGQVVLVDPATGEVVAEIAD